MGSNEASLVINKIEVNKSATMKKIKPQARGQSQRRCLIEHVIPFLNWFIPHHQILVTI
jgi:large subunit ribosomal protein L22